MWSLILRSIAIRKFRTFLTILGMTIGIMLVVILWSVTEGIVERTEQAFSTFDRISVIPKEGRTTVPYSLAEDIETITEVEVANPVVAVNAKRLNGKLLAQDIFEASVYPTVQGYEPERLLRSTFPYADSLVEGRFLNSEDHFNVVVGKAVADLYDIGLGSNINLDGTYFRVVGIYDTGDNYTSNVVVMPLAAAQQMEGLDGSRVESISVDTQSGVLQSDVAREIDFINPTIDVVTGEGVRAQFSGIETALRAAMYIIASVAAFVGGIGVLNSMVMSVMERRREIGIMKAVGWSKGEILRTFLIESTLMGFLGGAIGVVIGWLVLLAAGWLVPGVPTALSLVLVAQVMGFAVALGALGGLYPAWRAARVDPIEALRYA
jgi:putative ABC transport system permease protein